MVSDGMGVQIMENACRSRIVIDDPLVLIYRNDAVVERIK